MKHDKSKAGSPDRLRVNMDSSPISLDPRLVPDRNTRTCMKALFEGLARIYPDGEARLSGASSVSLSPDHLRYTFTIRPSQWSNGDPVTAYDFAYAWKSALSPDCPSPYAHLLYPIKGAKDAKQGRIETSAIGVTAVDANTLVVELEHPTPYLLNLLAHPVCSPVNHKVDRQDPDWARKKGADFVCNGPFILTGWVPEHEMNLSANPTYYESESVHLGGVDISFVSDPRTSLLMFENGELDWVGTPFCDLPLDALPSLESRGILKSQLVSGVYWVNCNTSTFPLKSVKIRRALSLALDRSALVDLIHQSADTTTSTVVPQHSSALQRTDANLAAARALFKEGLKELNVELNRLPPIQMMVSNISGQKALAQAMQQQWKTALGLNIELQDYDWNSFIANLLTGRYQLGGSVIDATFDDPICHLERIEIAGSSAIFWQNRDYFNCLNLARTTNSTEERSRLLGEAEALLQEEVPVIPINYDEYKYLVSDDVEGVFVSTLGIADFKWTTIHQAALGPVIN